MQQTFSPKGWRMAGLVMAALVAAGAASAAQQGTTNEGRRYISGGISDSEVAAMKAQRAQFSLWVVTAAKKSGAFLSDVRVTVTDSQQHVLFDAPLDGPWLMIDLPLGRYVIRATNENETHEQTTTIHPGDHHQIVFRFGVDADVERDAPPAAPAASK